MARGWKTQLERIIGSALKAGLLSALRSLVGRNQSPSRTSSGTASTRTRRRSARSTRSTAPRSSARPSPTRSSPRPSSSAERRVLDDFRGTPVIEYLPRDDGLPDPGEIVWSWVPYEEDRSQGKDRPVLIIGRDGGLLLGLMLTSKDHDRDEQQEARYGRQWIDIGSGDWDPQRRPSEVRVDRVLRIDPETVRREGAVLGRPRFDQVAAEVTRVTRVKRG